MSGAKVRFMALGKKFKQSLSFSLWILKNGNELNEMWFSAYIFSKNIYSKKNLISYTILWKIEIESSKIPKYLRNTNFLRIDYFNRFLPKVVLFYLIDSIMARFIVSWFLVHVKIVHLH